MADSQECSHQHHVDQGTWRLVGYFPKRKEKPRLLPLLLSVIRAKPRRCIISSCVEWPEMQRAAMDFPNRIRQTTPLPPLVIIRIVYRQCQIHGQCSELVVVLSIILSPMVSVSTCLPTIFPLLTRNESPAQGPEAKWQDVVITSGQAPKKVLIGAFPFCIKAADPLAGQILS